MILKPSPRRSRQAQRSNRPSLIACRTVIGFGAPNRQGSEKVHGAPLGDEEVARTRDALQWHHAPFEVPETVLAQWRAIGARCRLARRAGSSGPDVWSPMRGHRFMMR